MTLAETNPDQELRWTERLGPCDMHGDLKSPVQCLTQLVSPDHHSGGRTSRHNPQTILKLAANFSSRMDKEDIFGTAGGNLGPTFIASKNNQINQILISG